MADGPAQASLRKTWTGRRKKGDQEEEKREREIAAPHGYLCTQAEQKFLLCFIFHSFNSIFHLFLFFIFIFLNREGFYDGH